MEAPMILASDHGAVRVLTFNRPEQHNAVAPGFMESLGALLDDAVADDGVRAVVLTGRGRMFSAGGSLGALSAEKKGDAAKQSSEEGAMLAQTLRIVRRLYEYPKPTLALLNGPAAGGGLAVALACNLRMAADSAKLVYAYAMIGLAGDFGMNWLLGRLIGERRALSFALSPGWSAEEALRGGLVDAVIPSGELAERGLSRATELAAIPAPAFAAIRRNLAASALPFDEGTLIESESFVALRRTSEHKAALAALVERLAKPKP